MSTAIKTMLINTEKVKQDATVMVNFYDTYGEELATPEIFGDGYKIKR